VQFSIRYHDKNIYYPGDEISLKLNISNPVGSGTADQPFYLAEDPRHSFGFDLRSLTGDPMPLAPGLAAALNDTAVYRVVHLAPGQELSITVPLSQWVDLTTPGQYRLSALFYPALRGKNKGAVQADSVLDLTVMPETERRWEDQLDQDVRSALIRREMDPWGVVRETLENRRDSRYNRATLYLDIDSLARISSRKTDPEMLEESLLEGSWLDIPGFEHPAVGMEMVSSQIYTNEAMVRVKALYQPFGEQFERDLRFYLHNPEGYWTIRRVEAIAPGDADPLNYGQLDLNPPEVVSEMLRAVVRGDWEIVLRYLDITDLVRNLPENADRWNNLSAAEHRRISDDYRARLISGRLGEGRAPLAEIETWKITRVNYTDTQGSVTVENSRTYTSTANGALVQDSLYNFRLEKTAGPGGHWQVVRYDTTIIRR
jgi:hypothetical protein